MIEQFYFVLTERCNLVCSHCIRDSSPWRDGAAESAMVKRTIGEIAEHFPNSLVLLSGGEPTIHRGFRDILDFALSTGLHVNLNSNGVTPFFSTASLRELKNTSRLAVQISLDGDEATHDGIRGAGTYRKARRSLERLIERGIACCVSTTVVNNAFLDGAEHFIQSLDGLGLAHVALKRATHAGRATTGIEVDTSTWNRHVYRLRAMNWKTRLRISPMYDFDRLDALPDDYLAELQPSPLSINCGAGTAKVYIYGNGDVCPCTCFKDLPMGNLGRATLSSILQHRLRADVDHPACNDCRYLSRCRGGCLGSGYQMSGRLGTPDPRCSRVAARSMQEPRDVAEIDADLARPVFLRLQRRSSGT
jgi:AdoMet-dependent heme synthase